MVLGHCNDEQCQLLSRFLRVNRNMGGRGGSQSQPATPLQPKRVPNFPSESRTGYPSSGHPPTPMVGVSAPRVRPGHVGGEERQRGNELEGINDGVGVAPAAAQEVVAGVPHSSLRHADVAPQRLNGGRRNRGDLVGIHSMSSDLSLPPPISFSSGVTPGTGSKRNTNTGGRGSVGGDGQGQGTPHRTSRGRASPGHGRRMMDSSKAGVGLFFVQVGSFSTIEAIARTPIEKCLLHSSMYVRCIRVMISSGCIFMASVPPWR